MALSPEQIRDSLRPKPEEQTPAERVSRPEPPSDASNGAAARAPEPRPVADHEGSPLMERAERSTRRFSKGSGERLFPRSPPGSSPDIHRAPPHSAEAEQGMLCSMIIAPKTVIPVVVGQAKDEWFYIPAHRTIYLELLVMWNSGEAIDLLTFTQHLRDVGQLETIGGPGGITTLSGFVPSAANVDYYIAIVRDKYVLRQLVAIGTETVRRAHDAHDDPGAVVELARRSIETIDSVGTRFGRLPGLCDISVMLNGHRPERPPELIAGLLHQGSKLVVGGTSKGRKTFSLLDLAISVATGTQWWGFEATKGPVCYINFEIQESFFCERTADILRVKNLSLPPDAFMSWNLRGHSEGMENLVEEIVAKIISRNFALVIFDPIYKGLGDRDENKAGDIASLMNQLERVAVKTGAAIAFGAHYSKGNQAMKESIDRIGGSGVFARDPDSILTMTAHEEPDAFTVDCTLRNFKPIEPFVLKWDWPIFIRTDLDPEALKQPRKSTSGQFTARYSKGALLEELSVIEGIRPGTLIKKLSELEGISRAQFYRLAKQLRDEGKLVEKDGLWFRANIKKEAQKSDE